MRTKHNAHTFHSVNNSPKLPPGKLVLFIRGSGLDLMHALARTGLVCAFSNYNINITSYYSLVATENGNAPDFTSMGRASSSSNCLGANLGTKRFIKN